eukprot:m51a1_g12125 hypothetical protein (425) ;mRNA; f:115-1778
MANSSQPLQFRMGLASGPCSSAIVGLRKKFFDIWGPSVTLSQQIQESALPEELLCCNATRIALEAGSAVAFAFAPAGAGAAPSESAKVWKMSWDAGDTPRTECTPARSPSSVGLLSVVEGDGGIQYAEGKGRAVERVTSSLRFGIFVGNAALVLVFAGAVAGFLALTTSATTAALMSHRSQADMARVSHALASALANLRLVSKSWGQWVADGAPDGAFWREYHADGVVYNVQGVDGVLYFQLNGTLVNSDGHNYAAGLQRNLSSAEKAVVVAQLLRTGEVLGLVGDPQTTDFRSPIVVESIIFSDVERTLLLRTVQPSQHRQAGQPRLMALVLRSTEILSDEKRLLALLCGVGVSLLVFVIASSIAVLELLVFRGLSSLSRAIIAVTSSSETAQVRFQGNDQLKNIARSINHLLFTRDAQHHKE